MMDNTDILKLKYPAFAQQIDQTRSNGFSDDEIIDYIEKGREKALGWGYSPLEVREHMGITPESEMEYIKAVSLNKDKAVAFAAGKDLGQLGKEMEESRKQGVKYQEFVQKALQPVEFKELDEQLSNKYIRSVAADTPVEDMQYGYAKSQKAVTEALDKDRNWGKISESYFKGREPKKWDGDLKEIVEDPVNWAYSRTVGGIVVGWMNTGQSMAAGGEYLADILELEDAHKTAKSMADQMEQGAGEFYDMVMQGRDPDLWDSIMQGIGSTATFLFFGRMVAGLTGIAGSAAAMSGANLEKVQSVAKIVGSSTMATLESMGEAGSTYRDVLERTGDENAAVMAGAWTFISTLPSNFVTDKFAYFGEDKWLKTFIPKIAKTAKVQNILYPAVKRLASGMAESAQETWQGVPSAYFSSDDGWANVDMAEIFVQQGLPSFFVGALMGGAGGEKFAQMVDRVEAEDKRAKFREVRKGADKVVKSVYETLSQAGINREEAGAYSKLWGIKASVAAVQQGITPEEWLEAQGLRVQRGESDNLAELYQSQVASMKEVYGDQWMKSPNGEVSKLTEEQWVQVHSPEFKQLFGDWESRQGNYTKVLDENGEPLVVYHGTARPDRVGSVFDPDRATSGPMAMFTSSAEIAENYSRNKADTSLATDPRYASYETQFRVKHNGRDMSVKKLWYSLSSEERSRIAKIAGEITYNEDYDDPFIREEGNTGASGGFEHHLIEHKGNALSALLYHWVESGNLFRKEGRFLEILDMLGIEGAYWNDPDYRDPKVYPVYLNIQNPFDTTKVTNKLIRDLKKESKYAPDPTDRYADDWDKASIDAKDWLDRLTKDLENGTTYAWTSIPDWVTDYLKEKGYDGIFDQGGKYSDVSHRVYIPFESNQVKSAVGNVGTFDPNNPDIYMQAAVDKITQAISSANTSLRQVAATFKRKDFIPGDRNLDIGGGRFDIGTQYLAEKGVENVVFDPYNRTPDENRIVFGRLRSGERFPTVTANNVLNVIAEQNVRLNVVLQAAKALSPNGTAYFLVHEGNRTGEGKETTKGWQNNKKTEDYISEVKEHFNEVQRKGNLIIARGAINTARKAVWDMSVDINDRVMYQGERGAVQFNEEGKALVSLFASADKSTFLHESAHIFLKDMERFIKSGRATDEAIQQWDGLMGWLGVQSWDSLTTEERVDAHERFTRSFERYLMEGKAPVRGLEGLFRQFKVWLEEIYHGANDLDVPMNDEIRRWFDNMLGADEAIVEAVNRSIGDIETFAQSGNAEDMPAQEETGISYAEDEAWEETFTEEEAEEYSLQTELAAEIMSGTDEAIFEPDTWITVGEEVAGEIENMMLTEEDNSLAAQAYEAFKEFSRQVLEKGGLQYKSLVEAIGIDEAREVYRKGSHLFRRNVLEAKEVASEMGVTLESVIQTILNKPSKPSSQKFAPVVAIDEETALWLVGRMGAVEAGKYIRRRRSYVKTQYKAMLEQAEEAKATGNSTGHTLYTNEAARLLREQTEIDNALKMIAGTLTDPEALLRKEEEKQMEFPVMKWAEMAHKAQLQAVKWTQETVKGAIERVTGKTTVGELVAEREAIRQAYKFVERESRRAFKGGFREGILVTSARIKALKEAKARRASIRGEIQRLVREIDRATRGNVAWAQKVAITNILNGYDLKNRTMDTLEQRKMLEDYISTEQEKAKAANEDFNLDALNINEIDLAMLNKTVLNEMMLDDLRALHEQVMTLRSEGKMAYELKKARDAEHRDKEIVRPLLDEMGGPAAVTTDVIIPGKTKKGKQLRAISKALIRSLTPARVLDWMDGHRDFRGPWYEIFMGRYDEAVDNFFREKRRRIETIQSIMQEYGITEAMLAEERLEYGTDGEGNKLAFSLDEVLHIYIGWHNERTRDALKYGNNISDELASKAYDTLSENETAFAMAVMQEQEEASLRYNDAMIEAYDVGIEPEPYYTRMYRTQFTDSKGNDVDEGLQGIVDDLARQYALKKLYADKGSSYARKRIPQAYQQPISLGLLRVWRRSMMEHEHLIAFGKMVKDLHYVVGEKTDLSGAEPIAGMKDTIINTYGADAFDFLVSHVNTMANPNFYKSFKADDSAIRKVRGNYGLAYLWLNMASVLKQPQAIAYYMGYAGPVDIMASLGEYLSDPVKMTTWVHEMDPQVKEQVIDRFLEEFKLSDEPGWRRVQKRLGEIGFKPMEYMDMITRVVGWNAVYKHEIANGATAEEARKRAQRATLNTQNAAHPKELPAYMKMAGTAGEIVNLMTVFTNQANKIYGVAVHELYGDMKSGRYHKGFMTLMGLLLGSWWLRWLKTGEAPSTVEDIALGAYAETFENIPLIGSAIVAGSTGGFSQGSDPFWAIGNDLGRSLRKITKGEYEDAAMLVYEVWSIVYSGMPITALKRAIKLAETGDPSVLIGIVNKNRKGNKKQLIIP